MVTKEEKLAGIKECSDHLEALYTLGKVVDLAILDSKIKYLIEECYNQDLVTYELINKRQYVVIRTINELSDRTASMSSSYRASLYTISSFWQSIVITPREYRRRSSNPGLLPPKLKNLISMPEALLLLLISTKNYLLSKERILALSTANEAPNEALNEAPNEESVIPTEIPVLLSTGTSIEIEPFSIKIGHVSVEISSLRVHIRDQ
jgi:hypothetical protein